MDLGEVRQLRRHNRYLIDEFLQLLQPRNLGITPPLTMFAGVTQRVFPVFRENLEFLKLGVE